MKIALITLHWANNYGAALQVYACFKYLQNFGEVSVIDYRCKYTSKGMQVVRFGWGGRDFLRMGKDVLRFVPRYRVIKKFSAFNSRYLRVTSQVSRDEQFLSLTAANDVFISGSDQIWNPTIVSETGSIDGRYFLDFAADKKRVSYASSMGTYDYSPSEQPSLKKYLDRYDSISVREKDTAESLSNFLEREVTHVVDPTLLLTREDWRSAFSNIGLAPKNHKYILVYGLKKDKLLKTVVDIARKELGLKVYAVDQDPLINYHCDRHIMDAGPEEFVALVAGASFIVTNSFHGTAFAVNLNVPFLVTTPPTGANRINSLLGQVGLLHRVINSFRQSEIEALVSEGCDFESSNVKLKLLREKSKDFLKRALVND